MSSLHLRSVPMGLWQVILAAALWGTIGIATQNIYDTEPVNSLFLNLMRTSLATPILILACRRVVGPGMFRIPRRDVAVMAFAGSILAISHASYFAAIRYSGVTISTLLAIGVSPMIVSAASVLMKRERFTGRVGIALAASLIGSALLVGLNPEMMEFTNLPLGIFFSLLAAASYAGMIMAGRQLANRYHPLQTTAVMFIAGSIVLLVVNLFSGLTIPHMPQTWLSIAYLAVVPTAIAYFLLHMALRTLPGTIASMASVLEAVVAALLAWWLFGESLTLTSMAGAALLLFGLAILSWKPEQLAIAGSAP
ncbi:MAG: EamA family transporter [Chloroflexi bacterium]|nr:EamA family transporter [Chloroflexota bacterium]